MSMSEQKSCSKGEYRTTAIFAQTHRMTQELGTTAAMQLLPGGLGRSSFAVCGRPPSALRGQGYRLWDDRGNEVIDLNNNFTALVHGHAHPEITAAASEALKQGASFGLPSPSELRHAEALLGRMPDIDQIRYTNSGTEATMLALRIARAHTGRDGCIFLRNAYHGSSDAVLATGNLKYARGITTGVLDDVALVDVNDAAGLRHIVESEPTRFAAIFLDFMSNRAGLTQLDHQFIETAQTLCRRYGVLMIADEVVSFRRDHRGLAAALGAEPDLVALGKLIGGGLPIGAVAGRADVMAELDPTRPDGLEHGGTFSANPVVMAAGLASLGLLDHAAIHRINQLGDDAREALADRISVYGWEVRGAGSLFRPFPNAHASVTPETHRQLWWEAYLRGVLLTPQALATISTPMDANGIRVAVDKLGDAIQAIATGKGLLKTS